MSGRVRQHNGAGQDPESTHLRAGMPSKRVLFKPQVVAVAQDARSTCWFQANLPWCSGVLGRSVGARGQRTGDSGPHEPSRYNFATVLWVTVWRTDYRHQRGAAPVGDGRVKSV